MASDPSQLMAMLAQNSGLAGQYFLNGQQQAQQEQLNQQAVAQNAIRLRELQRSTATNASYQADAADYQRAPTMDKLASLSLKYPDHADAVKQFWAIKDPDVRQSHINAIAQPLSAIENGRVDLAISSLQKLRDATSSAKASDPQQAARLAADADELTQEIEALQSGDESAINSVRANMMMHIAAADPEGKFAESLARLRKASNGGDPYTLAPGDTRYDGNNKVVARGSDKPIDPFHYTLKDAAGNEHEYIYEPGAAGTSETGADTSGGSAPLSVRLNNPGAIRASAANQWQGQVGTENGFVRFDTAENGARAHRVLIANQIKAGYDTPLTWAQHYAPASDGNDPQAYAATVARGLGIGINDRIPLGAVPKMARLSAQVEGGGTPAPRPSGSAGGSRQIDPNPANGRPGADLGNPDLTGEAYLASLPAAMRAKVVAVADGRTAAPRPGTRYGEQLLTAVTQYDPTFDAANAQSRARTRVDFTSGKSAQAVAALNTAMGHLFHLDDQIADLGNVGFLSGIINPAMRSAKTNLVGSASYKKFDQTKQAAASEMRKVFAGSAGGNLTELKEWQESFDSAGSPAQLHAAVQNGIELMASRLSALQDQYATGMGRSDNVPSLIRPSTLRTAKMKFGVDLATSRAAQTAAPRSATRNPATTQTPVRVNSVAQARALRPGTRYVRPDGAVMVR